MSFGRGSRLLEAFQSPEIAPCTIGTAIVTISMASAPKGRMPPTEKAKSLSCGNALMTRRVNRRWPCQWISKASGVMNGVDSVDRKPPCEVSVR